MLPDPILLENITRVFNAALAGGLIKSTTDAQNMLATLDALRKRLNQAAAQQPGQSVPTLPAQS